jgi:outer membrane protein assembly factor BamB
MAGDFLGVSLMGDDIGIGVFGYQVYNLTSGVQIAVQNVSWPVLAQNQFPILRSCPGNSFCMIQQNNQAGQGTLYALNAPHFTTAGAPTFSFPAYNNGGYSVPSALALNPDSQDIIILASSNASTTYIYALSGASLSLVWTAKVSNAITYYSTPAISFGGNDDVSVVAGGILVVLGKLNPCCFT